MKVVEYWHGTIKNYRYDGDVSVLLVLMHTTRTHTSVLTLEA